MDSKRIDMEPTCNPTKHRASVNANHTEVEANERYLGPTNSAAKMNSVMMMPPNEKPEGKSGWT